MAYSDYGGYAFRDGVRVVERSDFTIDPQNGSLGFGTPGQYPGFGLLAGGMPHDQVMKAIEKPHYHVVLGDGPILIGMHKQSFVVAYRLPAMDRIPLEDMLVTRVAKGKYGKWGDGNSLDTPFSFIGDTKPTEFAVDNHKLFVRWVDTDNFYVFARLEQPDGVVWHGWSGYGVGAGLENSPDHGFAGGTERCNAMLCDFWPDAIAS